MKLIEAELTYVRSKGLYIIEKCDGCGKVLNQTFRHTIAGKRGVYCSAGCRDFVFFGDRHEALKYMTPKKCAYCGGDLEGKNRGAIYCNDRCRMRGNRAHNSATAKKPNSGLPESMGYERLERLLRQSRLPADCASNPSNSSN
jgi:hypothetical protein